jgi:hypothetical protein
MLAASITVGFGGAWARPTSPAVLANALALAAPPGLAATPSHSPIPDRTFGGEH